MGASYATKASAVLCAALALTTSALAEEREEFTSDFPLGDCQMFMPNGGNEFFSLEPGKFLRFEGEEKKAFIELEITVLDEVMPIVFEYDGDVIVAMTRVVEEREWEDGELVEVSRNFFGRCPDTDDIYYFGEDVDDYEDGVIVGHEGAWRAGEDGALPGLIMPGLWLLGSRYYQEFAPEVALDQAEHEASDLEVSVPAGDFNGCVMIVESSGLEKHADSVKIYAPGIGLIVDDALELVAHN